MKICCVSHFWNLENTARSHQHSSILPVHTGRDSLIYAHHTNTLDCSLCGSVDVGRWFLRSDVPLRCQQRDFSTGQSGILFLGISLRNRDSNHSFMALTRWNFPLSLRQFGRPRQRIIKQSFSALQGVPMSTYLSSPAMDHHTASLLKRQAAGGRRSKHSGILSRVPGYSAISPPRAL